MTIQDAKNEIAQKNGFLSWEEWGRNLSEPYGHIIPEKYCDQAWELHITTEYIKMSTIRQAGIELIKRN